MEASIYCAYRKVLYQRRTLPANHLTVALPMMGRGARIALGRGVRVRVVLNVQSTLQCRGCIVSGHNHFHQLNASIGPKFSTVEKLSKLLLIVHLVCFRARGVIGIIENIQQVAVVPCYDVVVLSVPIGVSRGNFEGNDVLSD